MNSANLNSIRAKLALIGFLFFASGYGLQAQTRMVLDGGIVTISQGAYLVIANPASNAITRNSGHIISEGENNRILWNIGITTGTYTIPWGHGSTDFIPVTFTKAAGTGAGYFLFSTYQTGWQNSAQLPSGVTNFNGATGTDNSAFASDRFWQVNALGYTLKPDLSNVVFTYRDTENAAAGNTITESGLLAKRYNTTLNSWTDNILTSTVNTTGNTVTVASVDFVNLQSWWKLGTLGRNRYWVAPGNSVSNLAINWSETSGGIGNAGVPTSDDAVIFDGISDANCTLTVALTAASLRVDTGYAGIINQGANIITLDNGATFSGGTFLGGSSDITVAGPFTLSGTSFTSTAATLDLKNNFSVTSGSFIHNSGTVKFSGTTTGVSQSISSSTTTEFNHLAVTNTAANPGVQIQSNQNLTGVLTLGTNAVLDADGSSNASVLTLRSSGDSPTQDAAVAALPAGASITGKITVQRFMTKEGPNNRIYRYIASPVQNASVSDIQSEIPITGSFTGTSVCSGCGTSQSMFSYNESILTDINGSGIADLNDGYVDFPNASNTETLVPGLGYTLFVRGNLLSSTSWDVRGTITAGNVTPVSLPVTFTSSGSSANDGWNLVGNPFASTIDWNAAGWTKTNVDGTAYTTDSGNATLQFATWNGVVGTNGGSRYIAMGQGFWTKANGPSPVLQATENIKAAGMQTTFFRESVPVNLLKITLVSGTTRDESVIHFRQDATGNFDTFADALKLPNATFNLSSLQNDGKKLAINSLASLDCSSEIKLSVDNTAAGSYRLSFSNYESFFEFVSITLVDKFTGSMFNVRQGSGYDFLVTSAPASYGTDRFKITFILPKIQPDFNVSANAVCEGTEATVLITNTQVGVRYVATDAHGYLSTPALGNGGTLAVSIPKGLVAGINTITIKSFWLGCSEVVEKSTTIIVNKIPEITSVESGVSCQQGGKITLKATGASEGSSYNWYDSGSSLLPLDQHSSVFITPELSASKTYYVAVVNALGCEGSRKSVMAEVIKFDNAQIEFWSGENSLRSNFRLGNQWYFNDEAIPQATTQFITPQQSGTYTLIVTLGSCTTSASFELLVTAIEPTEPIAAEIISVYPNPVSTEITIDIPDSFPGIKTVSVSNSLGQFIGLIELQHTHKTMRGHFDMTNFPAGLYILKAVGANGIQRKILKQ